MAMENSKVVYSSTGDFLRYLTTRQKEQEKRNNPRTASSIKNEMKRRNENTRYN